MEDPNRFPKNDQGPSLVPKFHEKEPFPFCKPVNQRKPVDRGIEFSAKCLKMSPILPFLPLNPLQPDPKGSEGTERLKSEFLAVSHTGW